MAAMTGTIKRIVSDKGFGFILGSDGNEYFFHNSACRDRRSDALREGGAGTFEKGQGPKGPRGENVGVAYLAVPLATAAGGPAGAYTRVVRFVLHCRGALAGSRQS